MQAGKAKAQETLAAAGRPPVHHWIKITLIAAQLRRTFPRINPTPLIRKLEGRLAAEGIKAPAFSELQKLMTQVFAFNKKP